MQNDLFTNSKPRCPIPIDKGIPIPSNRVINQRINWAWIKPLLQFERMQIGESIRIEPNWIEGADALRLQNYLSGAACSYRAEQPAGSWAFTTRQMPDGSVRLWRIDPHEAKGRGQ